MGRSIDLSALPQVTRDESERRIMVQLKEILDRVELPASNDVPDAQMMKAQGKTRWVVPKTEIAIQQIESGPRKGDYVFSSDTIDRLQSIYSIAKTLPYVTTSTRDWYERQQQYPIGPMMVLAGIVPPRWVLNEISIKSSKIVLLHQPLWRWAAILILCVPAFVFGRYMLSLIHI